MTMSADEARRSLAARVAERDLISTNLHSLYESVGMRLLAGASLAGTTKQTWDEANADLAAMLETFTAYSDALDRAAAMLGRVRRSAGPALAEVAALLTGASVRLTTAPAPLGRRGLTDSGQREITLTAAVEQMTKAFARVTKVVTEAETVWDEVTSRLDGIDDELGQARKQAAGLADDALTADVTAADEELRSLRSLLNSDPLALRQGDRVDTAGPDRLRARVSAAAARAGELARLRDDADRRIAGVGRAVAEAQAAGRDAAAARAEAAEKISAADLPWGPRADAGLAGTGLDRRLAAAQELRARGQWSRLAAEVASVEQAAAAAAERLRAAEREARWFLGQRHELWGRLRSYRAMADKLGGAEDPGLTTSYEQAEKLLVTTQCQLTAAADAVTRYQQAVLTFLGRGPGP
jgi:hypothetical protein